MKILKRNNRGEIMQKFEDYHIPEISIDRQADTVSVIIACYNVEKYIERCMKSIMNQTYKNLEIIAVDDGSKDATGRILDELAAEDSRIRVIHQLNAGRGGARNSGISAATGKYIAFVDGDDTIHSKMIEMMLSGLIKFGTDISVCRYREKLSDDTRKESPNVDGIVAVMDKNELLTCYVEEDEQYVIQNAVWNKLCTKELIGRLRMPEHKRYEDMVFTTKVLAKAEKACYIDTPLYNYTVDRKESIMNRGVTKAILTDQIPAYMDKDAYLESLGRKDLMYTHKYYTYKKLLLLYTEARRTAARTKDAAKAEEQKNIMKQLSDVINGCRKDYDNIYSCRVCDKHQKLRMNLFLKSPVLYNIFMDLNDNIVLPIRQNHAKTKLAKKAR